MKNLCEHYISEKCDKAKTYVLDAARDESNGHINSALHLMTQAKRQLESAIREIERFGKQSSCSTIATPRKSPTSEEYLPQGE